MTESATLQTKHPSPWSSLGILVTEAGIAGAPLLPLFLFATTMLGDRGRLRDVLPFVLFYSFLKTGCYAIRVFGKVNNPFRLAQLSALIVAAGSILTAFGPKALPCMDIGAILVGFGLSVFVPMYKTVKDVLRSQKQFPYHMETYGFLLTVVLVVVMMTTYRYAEQIILIGYCIMSLISIVSIHNIVSGVDNLDAPLFTGKRRNWTFLISPILLLCLVFFLRLFKQTGNIKTILFVFLVSTAIVTISIIPELVHGKRGSLINFHEFFYGEVIVILILYFIFYFASLGERRYLIYEILALFLGMFLAQAIGHKLVFAHPDLQISNLLMLTIMVAMCFLTIDVMTFPMLFILGFLVCLGFMRMTYLFRTGGSYSVYEQRMASQFAKNLGTIAGQWILLVTMTVVTYAYFRNGNQALMSYVDQIAQPDVQGVFVTTWLICLVILWIQVAFFLIRELMHGTAVYADKTPPAQTPSPDIVTILQ